jgi:23S rRNA (uracil1939-C5)-methyltransferase
MGTTRTHELQRGQFVTARIASIGAGGEGVTRDFGVPIFVHRAAPGDLAEIELFDVRKDFARGRVLRVIESSEQRAEAVCKLFNVCGGCQLQHLDYEWQLRAKEDIVRQAVKRIGGLDPELVKPAIPAEEPWFYRNKVQFPVANPTKSSRILAGYYKQDSHELVNVKHCPIQPEPMDRMLAVAKDACEQAGLKAYDERTERGMLRHITARISHATDKILVTLVLNARREDLKLQRLRDAAEKMMAAVPEIAGVSVNFNAEAGNKIFGGKTESIAGAESIIETLRSNRPDSSEKLKAGVNFRLSPTSFFQVNTVQAAHLLDALLEFVPEGGLAIDAYAGVGTIAAWLSSRARHVIAVEDHPAAVRDGKANLSLNGIDNVEFRLGSVEEVLPQLVAEELQPDVIVLDPPRKGVSLGALEGVIRLAASRIIYVSCNPATLARDLKILHSNGYKAREIHPVDMFPQTFHIESITVLDRTT